MNPNHLRLYAITDCDHLTGDALIAQTEALLAGGVTMLQLRDKNRSREAVRPDALALRDLCRRYKVPFIVNDDVELAREIDADGVHLGQDDAALRLARLKLGPDKIIGISAHNLEEARAAQDGGANYLGCGAVFTSSSKDAASLDHNLLKNICDTVDLPVVAIGGINGDNMAQLEGLGCAGAAVISALYHTSDPLETAKALRAQVEAVFGAVETDRPTALVIPLDRVLCDTHTVWAALAETYLNGVGKKAGPDLASILRPRTLAGAAAYIKHNYSVPDGITQMLYEFEYDLDEYYRREASLQPGAKALLETCLDHQVPVLAISDAPLDLMTQLADRTGCAESITAMASTAESHQDRDDATFYTQAADQLEANPQTVWVIEDHINGLRSAHRADCVTIAIQADGQSDQEWALLQAEADITVNHLDDLLNLLNNAL